MLIEITMTAAYSVEWFKKTESNWNSLGVITKNQTGSSGKSWVSPCNTKHFLAM